MSETFRPCTNCEHSIPSGGLFNKKYIHNKTDAAQPAQQSGEKLHIVRSIKPN